MPILVDAQSQPSTIKTELQHTTAKRRTNFKSHLLGTKFEKSLIDDPTGKQKLDSLVEFNFNETTQAWDKKFTKDAYLYDNNFNETLYVYSSWSDDDNAWKELGKEISNYDAHGNLTDYIEYVWGVNEQMNPFVKETYSYNNKNELIENVYHAWKNSLNDWAFVEKTVYSYDDKGKRLSDSIYYKYSGSEKWVLSKKVDYQYLNDELLHYIYKSEWDKNTKEWINTEKTWYLYGNIDWLLYTITDYKWDNTNAEWKRYKVSGYSYDDNGEVNYYTETTRDLTLGKYSSNSEKYNFDYNMSFDELVLPYVLKNYHQIYFHHKVINKQLRIRDFEANTWNQYRDIKYYYSPAEKPTVLEEVKQEKINVYPNPAIDRITIQNLNTRQQSTFKLYNNQGVKVMTSALSSNGNINLSGLKAGVYYYQVVCENKVQNGKLMIE